jgi:hypothetical protein
MSKGSKKSGKSKSSVRIADLEAMALVAPTPRGLKKQLRRLERQLVDAARLESKRLRKLERARNRRQVAEAALAFVLSEGPLLDETLEPAAPKTVAAPAALPESAPKAAPAKRTPAAAKPTAAKTAAAKTAPAVKPAAKSVTPRRTAARPKPAATIASPTEAENPQA